MSLKEKLTNFFGLTDEEEYYEEYPAYEQTVPARNKIAVNQGSAYMSASSAKPAQHQVKAANKTAPVQSHTQVQRSVNHSANPQYAANTSAKTQRPVAKTEEKVVSMGQPRATKARETKTKIAGKITIVEPRVYSEAMGIAKQVIAGDAVLVNFHLIEEYQARRIVDFLTGTVYAEDGDIKRVGDEIFLCTPKGMEIEGTAQSLVDTNMFDF